MRLAVLKSVKDYHKKYALSCEELGVAYEIIDGLGADWLDCVQRSEADGFLVRPPGEYSELRALYQERLQLLTTELQRPIYPTMGELTLYENKRYLSDWLKMFGYPHPETQVFTGKKEALGYISSAAMPLVFKTNVGSAGLGVRIIKKRSQAKQLARQAFGYFHPALAGGIIPRKSGILPLRGLAQKHYLIVQKFYPIQWEWRIIRIGRSYFGHQKLLKKNKASGSNRVGWVKPPSELLELVRKITDRHGFRSMAVDIFETVDHRFLINEMQSLFGSFNDAQMYINNTPGRFMHQYGTFQFEEGYFNTHSSYRLRVEDFCNLLRNKT